MKTLKDLFKNEKLICTLGLVVILLGIFMIVMIIICGTSEEINLNGITTMTTTTTTINTLNTIHMIIH